MVDIARRTGSGIALPVPVFYLFSYITRQTGCGLKMAVCMQESYSPFSCHPSLSSIIIRVIMAALVDISSKFPSNSGRDEASGSWLKLVVATPLIRSTGLAHGLL